MVLLLHQAVKIARQADQVKNQITQQHEASQPEEIRRNKNTFNKPKTKFNQNLSEKSRKRTCGRCNVHNT